MGSYVYFLQTHLPEWIVLVPRLWIRITLGAHEDSLFITPARQQLMALATSPNSQPVPDASDSYSEIDEAMEVESPLFDISPSNTHLTDVDAMDVADDDVSLSFPDNGYPMPPLLLASGIGHICCVVWDTTRSPEYRRLGSPLLVQCAGSFSRAWRLS